MATNLERLQQFRQLSRKQQYDAAYNAGANTPEEADQWVQELLQLGQSVPGAAPQIPSQTPVQQAVQQQQIAPTGADFSNVNNVRGFLDQLNNLSPEQGLGLLAFGTQLSQGIQPGQTAMSSFGQAAQGGLATTNAIRQQQVEAAQAQLEQELKMREALRKNRELQLKEGQYGIDLQDFERRQALGGLDMSDFRYATPESRQRYVEILEQTGDPRQAFTALVRDPDASARTTNNIIMPGGNIEPSKPTINDQQKTLIQLQNELIQLDSIGEKYASDYLTYLGRAKGMVGGVLDKLGMDDTEWAQYNADRAAFTSKVEQYFQAYRSRITGAAAAVKEMEMLRNDFLNKDLGPAEFQSKWNDFVEAAKRGIEESRRNLQEGITPGPTVDPQLGGQRNEPRRTDQSQVTPSYAPPVGTIDSGYRFKGGDPANPDNWEQVQ